MAEIRVSGITGLIKDLEDLAWNFPHLCSKMMNAEADVLEPAIKKAVADNRLVQSRKLQDSIGRVETRAPTSKSSTCKVIKIGPSGEHHRYMPSVGHDGIARAGHIGYMYEYGVPSRGIEGRLWMKKAVEKNRNKAYDAADAVYDQYMKKHNL